MRKNIYYIKKEHSNSDISILCQLEQKPGVFHNAVHTTLNLNVNIPFCHTLTRYKE